MDKDVMFHYDSWYWVQNTICKTEDKLFVVN